MKKEYIKPEIAVEQFISECYMFNTSNENEGNIAGEGGEGNEGEYNTNSHRGSWGNLWD